ncbi:terpenoid synthase [Wolfiporia cocos MD-104 SS10]|uniref:Terpenoid synthase n=1 Tax=Wolfiporia cocos (strain MD-104) TaxID=742152 RepID=A0A2H3IXD5_WOLCO|nr:terpenoid synthase [Wolfiporia cocos MD-104 SS10]
MCAEAVREFLHKMQVSLPQYPRDPELEARVRETLSSWGHEKALRPYIITGIMLTITAYSHITDFETKVQIALFTTFIIAMDDPAVLDSIACREFHQAICFGTVQKESGLFNKFNKILQSMWGHYPTFTANTIYASALRFVNAAILEKESAGTALSSDSLPYVEYKRSMTATTEAYACFIWEKSKFPDVKVYMQAIPDVTLYVSYVNDILSFYKEELAGEEDNYIHERATISGKSVIHTLQDVINDTVAAVGRIRDVLGEGEARDAFESFAAGYIGVHTETPRYRLKEITGGQYIMDVANF